MLEDVLMFVQVVRSNNIGDGETTWWDAIFMIEHEVENFSVSLPSFSLCRRTMSAAKSGHWKKSAGQAKNER